MPVLAIMLCALVNVMLMMSTLPSLTLTTHTPRFNSYTQQICIDDAVVIDAKRAENVMTNDGSTMRIMVQSMGKPSAWSRQKEIVLDDRDRLVGDHRDGAQAIKRNVTKAKTAEPNVEGDKVDNVIGQGSADEPVNGVPAETSVKESNGAKPAKNDATNVSPLNVLKHSNQRYQLQSPEAASRAPQKLVRANGSQFAQVDEDAQGNAKVSDPAPKDPSPEEASSLIGKPEDVDWSNYTSQGANTADDGEKKALMMAERERELEEKRLRREREKELREAEKERKQEEKQRREEQKKNVEWATATWGYTKEELAAMKHNIKFEDRFNGMLENKRDFDYDPTLANGPSQVRRHSRYLCLRELLTQISDCYIHKPIRG